MRHLTTSIATVAVSLMLFACAPTEHQFAPSEGSFDISSVAQPPSCRDMISEKVQPRLKWDWYAKLDKTQLENYHRFSQVMSTPVVKDLNGDGVPEVVFTSFGIHQIDWAQPYSGLSSYYQNGVLRIVNGKTGATIRSIGTLDLAPVGTGQPLLVDLDGDGKTEIVYLHYSRSKLIALDHNGNLRWTRSLASTQGPGAEIGTYFDAVKKARLLIVGKEIITENKKAPVVVGSLPSATGGVTSFVYPVDPENPSALFFFDSTGAHDLRTGARTIVYPQSSLVAVAELSATDRGFEVVGTGGGRLWIMNTLSGRKIVDKDLKNYNPLLCPAGSIGGGVPTVGDFDGDPLTTEIAMATGKYLTIFSAAGELIAQKETQDCSSLATGISSFDFNGDGKQEIVYSDEEYLRIYEIRSGQLEEIWKTVNPSGTLYEYPVIVDVDGNGSSEIVVASNNYPVGSFYRGADKTADQAKAWSVTGVRAFESADQQAWMPTPSSWPQFSYNPVMEALANSRGNAVIELLEGFLGKTFRQNAALTATRLGCQE